MRRRRRNSTNWSKVFIFWAILGIIFAIVIFKTVFSGTFKSVTAISLFPSPTPTIVPQNPIKPLVDAQLKDAKGTYAVVVKDLKHNDNYEFNEHKKFDSASLYKMWVLAVVYQMIEKGDIKEDQVLTAKNDDLNDEFDIPRDQAEQVGGKTTYKVKDALEKMITISDNYASLLLTHTVTYDRITDFLKANGLYDSHVGVGDADPETSAYDAALFYEKLYQNKFANKENTQEMIALLKRNEFNTVIPKYIETDVAHKTGALESLSHDAGIVFTPQGAYVIALLSETGSPPDAEERMAVISQNVFSYFKNRKEPEIVKDSTKLNNRWNIVVMICIGVILLVLYLRKRKKSQIMS